METTTSKRLALSLVAIFLVAAPASADETADFYKGKQIRLIVSSEPGGGYDNYARLAARHLERHIPGNPNIIVQNMPGGGGLNAANYIHNVAPKDGTVIGLVQRNVPFVAILGQPGPQFDPTKFFWLASLNNEVNVCVAWHTSKVKTIEDALKHELIVGGSGPNDTEVTPALLNNIIGTKFRIISGYPSSSAVTLAMERGEVEGLCSSYSSISTRNADWLEEKKVNILVQSSSDKHPELPNVPLSSSFAKTDEDRQLLDLNDARLVMGRPFLAAPGIPEARSKALRAAFAAMVKDPQFIADVKKLQMEVNFVPGEKVQALIERVAKTPKAVIDRFNDAQTYKGPRETAKISAVEHSGKLREIQDGGRRIVLGTGGGKMLDVEVSGSRTKITLAGAPVKRSELKPDMQCTVAVPEGGKEAATIACKK